MGRARQRGSDVRGYFHWTPAHNREWLQGFSDARGGLIGSDASAGDRHLKRLTEWFRKVIAAGTLNPAIVASFSRLWTVIFQANDRLLTRVLTLERHLELLC